MDDEVRIRRAAPAAWLDQALAASGVGGWRIDYRQGSIVGSDEFWSILGLPKAAFVGVEGLSTFVDPRDWPQLATTPEGSGPSGDFAFEIHIVRSDGQVRLVALRGAWENCKNSHYRTGVAIDLTGWSRSRLASVAKAQEQTFLEQRHRLRNLFTIVASLIKMVGAAGDSLSGYRQALLERIRALESTHLLLADNADAASTIRDLVLHELRPYARADDATIEGPSIKIANGAAESFAMVVHELCTNSVKHGVLGGPLGDLEVRWGFDADGSEDEIVFDWIETGRSQKAPRMHGFGSMILGADGNPIVGHSSKLEVTDDGLRYSLRLMQSEI